MTLGADSQNASGAGARWRDRDHTRGSLFTSLLVLSLPLLATSLAGVIFQLTDLKLVSGLGGDATTAVIVTNQSLRQLFFMLVMGASFGAQGLISRRVGEGDTEGAEHIAGQVVVLGLVFSTTVAVFGLLFAEELLSFMNVSAGVLTLGVPYVRLVFLLNFLFVFLFLFNAILNGAGDTTTPLVISLIQSAVSLAGEWCLMYGKLGAPRLGVPGVALGLALGQLVAVGLCLRVLFSGSSRLHLRRHHLRPDPAVQRELLALSWPPGLQMLGGFLVNVIFIRMMGDFGDKAQTAFSIGLRLSMVGPMLAFPLAGACSTMIGQNLGASKVGRAWRALGTGLVVHVTLLWSVAAVLVLFRTPIVSAFSQDPEVIRIGSELLLYQAGAFTVWAFYFVFFRALQGAGDVFVPMLLSLGNSLLVTLPLGAWLAQGRGPTGLFMATVVGATTVTLATGAWLATGRWTRATPRDPGNPARATRG